MSGVGVISDVAERRIEELFLKAFEMHKPFFDSMLAQMHAIEQRMGDYSSEVGEMKTVVEILASQELLQKISVQDARIKILETERQERVGMVKMMNWAPKVIVAMAFITLAIMLYWKSQGH